MLALLAILFIAPRYTAHAEREPKPVAVESAEFPKAPDRVISDEALLHLPLSTSTVRAAVEHVFGTSSIMVEVARCESLYRQFGEDGKVLRGKANPKDVGVFQINERYHLATSEAMGLDIGLLQENLEYAHYLYNRVGTTPWEASRECWGKHLRPK